MYAIVGGKEQVFIDLRAERLGGTHHHTLTMAWGVRHAQKVKRVISVPAVAPPLVPAPVKLPVKVCVVPRTVSVTM